MTPTPSTPSPVAIPRRWTSTIVGIVGIACSTLLVAPSAFGAPDSVQENREIRSPVRSSPPPPPPPRRASPPPPPPRRASPPPTRSTSRVDRERFNRDRVRERVDRRRISRDRWRDERNIDRYRRNAYTSPPATAPIVNRGRGYDDRRRYRARYPYYGRHYGGYFRPYGNAWYEPCYFGFYSPFSFWPAWSLSFDRWGSRVFYRPGRGPFRSGRSYGYSADRAMGALDVDVRPDEALVFVDGQPVGAADAFDGFPRYLWLEEGTYEIAIYLPGYETIFRQITIYPGLVIDVDDKMREGESIHPDDHGPTSTKIRDERLRREAEKQARAAAMEAERAEIERTIRDSIDRAEAAERRQTSPPPPPEGGAVGRLVLDVVPGDAAVYLDGYFLGLGAEVSRLRAGFVLEPGEHLLEVSRPGFGTREIPLVLDEGERFEMVVEMEPKSED